MLLVQHNQGSEATNVSIDKLDNRASMHQLESMVWYGTFVVVSHTIACQARDVQNRKAQPRYHLAATVQRIHMKCEHVTKVTFLF